MESTSVAYGPKPVETREPWRARLFPNNEWVLLGVIALECLVFGVVGVNFLTAENAFEITRLAVVIGLLALAMTPIIITGGIDLSVGSMMALAAVVLGALWRDAGVPIGGAIAAALVVGLLGGALNAFMIARLSFPPLIVTLGTFSLFRGIAEGLTRGIDNYSGFSDGFLFLGQGYIGGVIPTQLLVLIPAVAGLWWWLHRTSYGRALYAIGHSAEGARHAGIPVGRRVAFTYLLSGLVSSVAAVIYVAYLGQAKSDAGTGFELTAITAVVLGGASIFGGRGTALGTVLGLFSIVILQNGLRLSGQPAELAGVLTGLLLVGTVLVDRLYRGAAAIPQPSLDGEEFEMRNSQVAIISGVILAAALIVASSNWMLVRSIGRAGVGAAVAGQAMSSPDGAPVVAMMPKARGDPYFISARGGAEEAARELGVTLLWDGPTDLDPARQNEVVEAWITRGVDVIAVSVENRVAISSVLRRARERGIHVLTWDADAEPDARDFLVNQATPQGIGYTLADEAARIMEGAGDFAIITASLSAANQNEWIRYIEERIADRYPDLRLVAIQPSDGDRDRAFTEAQTLLRVHPQIEVIMA
ncbi:MAG TPA: substrate-binding domain-containing protein, partial [Longimicrobiales bacterium]|nr:substrate-binding domain-containing protein [Longimicrobiales bacterium]